MFYYIHVSLDPEDCVRVAAHEDEPDRGARLGLLHRARDPHVPRRDRHPLLGQVLHRQSGGRLGRHRPPHPHHAYLHRLRSALLSKASLSQVRQVNLYFH